jgi:hypothetical protein
MMHIDEIEKAIAIAAAETGVRGGKSNLPLCFTSDKKRNRIWTKEEDEFLRDNYGRLSDAQIAKHFGRTPTSVHIHREREMHLGSMSKHHDILTAEQIACGLCVDGKSIAMLMDRGLMPCRRLPSSRVMRVIDRVIFVKWLLDTENWLYFKPERVGLLQRRGKRGNGGEVYDFAFWEGVRRAIIEKRKKWNDEWLTPGQVVSALKINPKATPRRKPGDKIPGVRYVNLAIHKGNLKAKRWQNWKIKRSDLPGEGKTINFRGQIVEICKGEKTMKNVRLKAFLNMCRELSFDDIADNLSGIKEQLQAVELGLPEFNIK